MQEDKLWTALLAKERRLADHEWELYQKLGKAKTQEEDVLCQLDSMGTWFHDLSYDFEGSRYYSKIVDCQLDFSHRSRQLKLDIENQIQKLRKKHQNAELSKFGIIQSDEQYVFTYIDMKGNVNSPLHSDYLNNKMKSVKRRHPELKHATPHKLRHTGATLAKQAGMSLEAISEALTHSDTGTTQIYVNTSNVVPMTVGEFALKSLKQ